MAAAAQAGDPVAVARAFLNSLVHAGPLVVAVSGGGDSVALLAACQAALSGEGGAARRLIAATVDHGLRPGSAAEARQVGAFCAELGIEHRILEWTGEKPATGVQAAARMARYRLLAGLAREAGAAGVATAHTRDDQAETVAMRAGRRDDGSRGLAGMAPATLFERSCWILRPFLGVARDDLRRWLSARGIAWIDDPSNDDERFERVRVRRHGLSRPSDDELARWRRSRLDDAAAVAGAIAARAECHGGIVVSLDLAGGGAADPAVAEAARLLMSIAGGRAHLAGRETAGRLAAFIGAGRAGGFTAARALAGLAGGRLWIHRERRDLPSLALGPGERGLYDGRYRLANTGSAPVRVVPPGLRPTAGTGNLPPLPGLPAGVARRALSAEPVLVRGGREAFLLEDGLDDIEVLRHFAPFDVFLPLFDIMLAARCAALFGQKPYPPPPLAAPTA